MSVTSRILLLLTVPGWLGAAAGSLCAQEEGVRVDLDNAKTLLAGELDSRDLTMSAGPSGYTVVWSQAIEEDCCSRAIFALALDAQGDLDARFGSTAPLRLDPGLPFHDLILPDVATGQDGTQYVVWYDLYDFTSHLVTVSPSGERSAPRRVHEPNEHWQTEPAVATDLDGSVWVAWATSDVGDDGVPWPPEAFARRFDRAGNPLDRQFLINDREPANGVTDAVDLAFGTGGRVTTVFRSDRDLGFFLRRFDRDGRPLAEEQRWFGPQGLQYREGPKVCGQPGGGSLLLAIDETDGLWSRHIDAQGALGPPIQVSAEVNAAFALLQLACSPFGGAVTAWLDVGVGGPHSPSATSRVALVELGPTGVPIGEPSFVPASGDDRSLVEISLALGAGGHGVLVTREVRRPDTPPSETGLSLRSYPLSVTRSRTQSAHDLRFEEDRFNARVLWRADWESGSGLATTQPLTDDTGAFWFFRSDNLELTSKLLDARALSDSWWFFYSALTTVEHWIELTDRINGQSRSYHNLPGGQRSLADTQTFHAKTRGPGAPTVASVARQGDECGDTVLCLGSGFEIEVDWLAPTRPSGPRSGAGQAAPISADTGSFWFFRPDNLELLIKVLDGRSINGHFWVFWASLSGLEFTIRVSNGEGLVREYLHEPGTLGGDFDLEAFP